MYGPEPQKWFNVKELDSKLYELYKIINSDKSNLNNRSCTYIDNKFFRDDIIINQFFDSNKKIKELQIIEQKHPDHLYMRKLINIQENIKRLSKIVGSDTVPEVEITNE
ncbi:hypothetical protein C2G38_2196270 [Gigaspora rosea]|uniref:Uncharacterized protein n=1 Tax=Gigaspora rosea TaxID=44941 RepID=A0A397UW56_9GLOM|nr:hypothetical protein C2G38_2196270 [Gigaspora rosea]